MSATFLATQASVTSSAGQFSWKTTAGGGTVTLELWRDPAGGNARGHLVMSVAMSTAEASALGTALSTPTATTGP